MNWLKVAELGFQVVKYVVEKVSKKKEKQHPGLPFKDVKRINDFTNVPEKNKVHAQKNHTEQSKK